MTQDQPTIEEIVITATLMSSDRDRMSSDSLTAADLSRRSAMHFEDVLTTLPNVAASAGASRQRFFQIRGIGERSQFIEPINPSVVILQDGVDISGIGGARQALDLLGMPGRHGIQEPDEIVPLRVVYVVLPYFSF